MMKTNFTQKQIFLILAAVVTLLAIAPQAAKAQNLIKNPSLSSGHANWDYNNMKVEINSEKVYGGKGNNSVAEIDKEVGLRQRVEIEKGATYAFSFDASRRTAGGTVAKPGLTIRVTGSTSGTVYVNENKTYSNTSFSFSPQTVSFTIPANSADKQVIVELTAYNNNTTLGVIVDNFSLMQTSSLPVTFDMVNAGIDNGKALLTWITSHELNNAGFSIEHSADGQHFEELGTVAPGNGTRNRYTYRDAQPRNGVHYYRIRQNDLDGRVQYSKTLMLNFATATAQLQLYPVPVSGTLNIKLNLPSAGTLSLMICDAQGHPVKAFQVAAGMGMNLQTIDLSGLKPGMYVIKITEPVSRFVASAGFSKG